MLPELKPVLDAARARRRVVKVGYNHRFHPAFLKAKALVDSGEAGDLLYIRGRYGHGGRKGMEREWRCQPSRSGGGELIDQGPHLVDLSRWFLSRIRSGSNALLGYPRRRQLFHGFAFSQRAVRLAARHMGRVEKYVQL